LRLADYYRQFAKYFASIAKPLHQLIRKDKKWNWERELELAFKKLKEIFTT